MQRCNARGSLIECGIQPLSGLRSHRHDCPSHPDEQKAATLTAAFAGQRLGEVDDLQHVVWAVNLPHIRE